MRRGCPARCRPGQVSACAQEQVEGQDQAQEEGNRAQQRRRLVPQLIQKTFTGVPAAATASDAMDGLAGATEKTVQIFGTFDATVQLQGGLPQVNMTGDPNLVFAEVGATGDTITRDAGSFIDDGFSTGDIIVIEGSPLNSFTSAVGIAGVTGPALTMDTDDLAAEVTTGGVTITGNGFVDIDSPVTAAALIEVPQNIETLRLNQTAFASGQVEAIVLGIGAD